MNRRATPESLDRAKWQLIYAALICLPMIIAAIVMFTWTSNFNDVSNITCDPSKRLSCTHVDTPLINQIGDVWSFLLTVPALVAIFVFYVYLKGWRDETKKPLAPTAR